MDNKSPSYAKNTSQCEFFIKPFNNTNWGLLDSPRHSLPPNTSCKYHFQGSSHQTVWLSFIKYHAASTDPNAYHLANGCNAKLQIWDKVVSTKTKKVRLQPNFGLIRTYGSTIFLFLRTTPEYERNLKIRFTLDVHEYIPIPIIIFKSTNNSQPCLHGVD